MDTNHLLRYLNDDTVRVLLGLFVVSILYSTLQSGLLLAGLVLNYILYRASRYPYLIEFRTLYTVFLVEVLIIDLILLYYLRAGLAWS